MQTPVGNAIIFHYGKKPYETTLLNCSSKEI
jgi:hypothetical protein